MKRWHESKIVKLCALGILVTVADGLMNGLGWRAIVAGALLAVVAVVRVYWTSEAIGTPPVPPTSLLLPLLLAAGLGGGCSTTVASGLDKVQTGVEVTWKLGYVPISAECRRRAAACKGKVSAPAECVPWVQCDAVRSLWDVGHKQTSTGLLTIKEAHEKAKAAGLIEGGK